MPVLRAGLGMAEAAFNLLPESQMGFVGLARDEETHEPHPYMASLPESLAGRPVIVLDPMLATGGSLLHCLHLLADRGADDLTVVCALAAPEGLAALEAAGLPVRLFTASIDERAQRERLHRPGPRRRRRPPVRPALTHRSAPDRLDDRVDRQRRP